jgi:threonine dehydrogenase-like Zn-dependent dehydrogenase
MTTETLRRINGNSLWLPIGTIVTALLVVGGAAVTWATDRAELRTTSDLVRKQGDTIDVLKEERAARRVLDESIKEQLKEMRASIDRIAERVGVKQ